MTFTFLLRKSTVNFFCRRASPLYFSFVRILSAVLLRQADGHWTSSAHPFSGKVFCGECGGQYGSKVWDSNTEAVGLALFPLILYKVEYLRRNDSRMTVLYIILRNLALVDFYLFAEKIHREFFLQDATTNIREDIATRLT